ncbi:MAG: hypothetical protein Q8P59_03685 [Dehalococcoidia bacterium]|nr:hypothetical protein [Dehalococcoidia bacterium]
MGELLHVEDAVFVFSVYHQHPGCAAQVLGPQPAYAKKKELVGPSASGGRGAGVAAQGAPGSGERARLWRVDPLLGKAIP